VIYDAENDTEGFVGYLPSKKYIYVVYRGTQTWKNKLTDAKFIQATYDNDVSDRRIKGQVHSGFLSAE